VRYGIRFLKAAHCPGDTIERLAQHRLQPSPDIGQAQMSGAALEESDT